MSGRSARGAIVMLLLCLPGPAHAWQDLAEDYVRAQLEVIDSRRSTAVARLRATWALVTAGRAAVFPLGRVARTHPRLTWKAVHLLDAIRTDGETVSTFSALLDAPPRGLPAPAAVARFLRQRLEDMTGQRFPSAEARRRFVIENREYLVYDPATFRFSVDGEARRRRRALVPTPQRATGHEAVDRAYARLILALYLGNVDEVHGLVGPRVQLARKQGRVQTMPGLDLDAFTRSPAEHRALLVRREAGGQWLVRSGRAYFRFGGPKLLCLEAGLKPIE